MSRTVGPLNQSRRSFSVPEPIAGLGYWVPALLTGYLALKGLHPDLPWLGLSLRALTGIPCPTAIYPIHQRQPVAWTFVRIPGCIALGPLRRGRTDSFGRFAGDSPTGTVAIGGSSSPRGWWLARRPCLGRLLAVPHGNDLRRRNQICFRRSEPWGFKRTRTL